MTIGITSTESTDQIALIRRKDHYEWFGVPEIQVLSAKFGAKNRLETVVLEVPPGFIFDNRYHWCAKKVVLLEGCMNVKYQDTWADTPTEWVKLDLNYPGQEIIFPPYRPHKALCVKPTLLVCSWIPGIDIVWADEQLRKVG